MLSVAALEGFGDELLKLAALTDAERGVFKQVLRQHQKFEQQSAAGELDDAAKAEMRDNVERLKQYKEKSKGTRRRVDSWVRDPSKSGPQARAFAAEQARPRGGGGSPFGSAEDFARNWQASQRGRMAERVGRYGTLAGLGATLGGVLTEKPTAKEKREAKVKEGPITNWMMENPRKAGALTMGTLVPAIWGPRTLPGTLAGLGLWSAGAAGVGVLDKSLKKKQQAKKAA
jgi:hypothetical protein